MVIIAIPQVEAEQDDVVAAGGGAAGAAGVTGGGIEDDIGGIDDIDDPPPQALKTAINKTPTAAGIHRLRVANAFVVRLSRCMEVLPVNQPLCV